MRGSSRPEKLSRNLSTEASIKRQRSSSSSDTHFHSVYEAIPFTNQIKCDCPVDSLDDFKPFYYGKMPYTGNVRRQTGSAAYAGGATGVYRLNGGTAVNGRFTADVSITANFGSNTDAAALKLRMSNFATRISAGTAAGPEIESALSSLLIADAAGSSFTGTGSFTGKWGGRFFGPSGGKPTGIAGWFEKVRAEVASSTNFVVLRGVFGAKKQ